MIINKNIQFTFLIIPTAKSDNSDDYQKLTRIFSLKKTAANIQNSIDLTVFKNHLNIIKLNYC